MLNGISQRHGFPQDGVADQRAQRQSNHHLYTLAQDSLKVGCQAPWKPWRGVAGHVDKQVHIAFRCIFPTSHRAEEPNFARAVEGGHPQNFVAMFLYVVSGTHSSVIVPLRGSLGCRPAAVRRTKRLVAPEAPVPQIVRPNKGWE